VNWLDIIFGVILLFSAAMSFRRGFTREIVGLAASVLALLLGMWFYGMAGAFIEPYVGSKRGASLIGFFLVVMVVMLLGALVGWVVSRFVKTIGLSFVDRLLGGLFGLIRGVILCIAMLIALTAFGPHGETDTVPEGVLHSRIAPWLLEASEYGVAIAPMELKQTFRKYYTEVKEMWKQRKLTKADKDS
jgi:membrane protein required for colicin V production